jgi:predicted translin family RNA/ssDNA-binding protein
VTKEDFIDWKSHPVTKAYFQTVADRIGELKEQLVGEVGSEDFHQAARTTGAIRVLLDILEIDFEESQSD